MRPLTELTVAFTQGWVRLYTRGLPPEAAERRRAEVVSDLWEQQHDGRSGGVRPPALAFDILRRAVLGVPDDLGWRRETMRTWRAGTREARRTAMTLSVGSQRGMGIAAVLGGLGWTAGSLIPDTGRTFEAVYVISSMLLATLGVFGFYLQQRPSAGRVGAIGLVMLLVGFTSSFIAVSVAELVSESHAVAGVLGILAWPLLIPLGFLFVGLGVSIRYRYVVLAVGALLILGWLTPVRALREVFAPAGFLFSNVGTGLLWAIGLVVIGAAVVSGTRGPLEPESDLAQSDRSASRLRSTG